MKVKNNDVVIELSDSEMDVVRKALEMYAKSGARLADKFPVGSPTHKALMSDVATYRSLGARFSTQPELGV